VKVKWLALVGVASLLLSCGEATAIEGTARRSAVIEQLIREIVGDEPVEPETGPVVYVLGVDGTISIEVQASVAASLVDDIDVRFADERSEAIVEVSDEQVVRDDGILLVIGDIPEEGRTIDVEVERYRSLDDRDRVVVSLRWRDPEWTVTSTLVPPAVID
jgi:hypothetical protein